MSVLVTDPHDKRIKLYTKGADSIIKERLRKDPDAQHSEIIQAVDEFTRNASVEGLRTLLVAVKVIDRQELERFLNDLEALDESKDLEGREEKLE